MTKPHRVPIRDYSDVIERVAREIFYAQYDPRDTPPKQLIESWWTGGRDVGSSQYLAAVRQARAAIITLAASGLMQGDAP